MKIKFTGRARKDAEALDSLTRKRIRKKLDWYMSHDNPLVFADSLTDFKIGQYRYRIGDYRVIFEVGGDTIYVTRINHRKEVYR